MQEETRGATGTPIGRGEDAPSSPKPKTKTNNANSALKENTTCPDCGITLTVHGLNYTYKRYCTTKPKVVDLEDVPPPPPSPPGLVRQTQQ